MKHPHELWGELPPGIREFATKMATGAVLGAATAGLYHLMGSAQAQQPQKPSAPAPQGRWANQEYHRQHRHHGHKYGGR